MQLFFSKGYEMIKTRFFAIFSLIAFALTLAGCDRVQEVVGPEQPVQSEAVKIGFIGSGSRVTFPNGAEIAVAEINEMGGLLGMPVELVIQVGIEEAAVAAATAESMIHDEGVVAILGPNRSTHAIEVAPVAQKYGVPMITTTATNPNVTNAGDFVFMASATDLFQGTVMAQFATKELGAAKVAVMAQQGDVYAEGLSEIFTAAVVKEGGEVVANEFYEADARDFTEQLTRLAATAPDALLIAGFAEEVLHITKQARAMNLQNAAGNPTIFLGTDAWDSATLLESEEARIEGSFFSAHFSPSSAQPTTQAFVKKYEALHGTIPIGGMAVSYDCVKLFAAAVERAGSLDAAAVRDEIAATKNYVGVTNIGGYNENRHPSKSIVIMTVKAGMKEFYKQLDP